MNPSEKRRLSFFIDGFNVYHSLKKEYPQYLWLDYHKLAELFMSKRDVIKEVIYFTALAKWKPAAERRHRTYIRALESRDVEVVYGRFKISTEFCKICRKEYDGHREKQTDVNIVVNLFCRAYEDTFDRAILVTADSDLVPAVREVKKTFPGKEFYLMAPLNRRCYELENIVDHVMYIKHKHLKQAQFPNPLHLQDGTKLHRPISWQ